MMGKEVGEYERGRERDLKIYSNLELLTLEIYKSILSLQSLVGSLLNNYVLHKREIRK